MTDSPRFIFKSTFDYSDKDFMISVARDAEDEYGVHIGRAHLYVHKKPGYWMLGEPNPENLKDHIAGIQFDTKEKAAEFLYLVHSKSEEYRTSKPLPDDVCDYLTGRTETLKKELEELRRRFFEIQIERFFLRKLGNRNQISRVMWNTDDSDKAQLVRDLMKFEVWLEEEGRSVTFVSEAALYSLIGKDDARSVLGMINKLCEAVAPDALDEIEEDSDG